MINFDLKDRVAIVTGGAQGFGLAITERFIASGASVVIWDIDEEAIKTAIKKINSNKVSYQIVDVGNYENICLLYTSPSPRDLQGSRMPSSA